MALASYGETISRFPPAGGSAPPEGASQEQLLFASRSGLSPLSRLLPIPVRIIAVRNYYAAKCQAFALIADLVGDTEPFKLPVRRTIIAIMCAFLTEEVYFTCLEDRDFPQEIKSRLAGELASMWDGNEEPQTLSHAAALEALWAARDAAPPSFGTMDGSSELLRVSFELDKDWQAFISSRVGHNETRWALEEFLFGLSYEEISAIRESLINLGINAVNRDEVRLFLGRRPKYVISNDDNPLGIYDFFIDRRDAAALRRETAAPGPRQTLEEMYLRFRLAGNREQRAENKGERTGNSPGRLS